MLVYNHSSHWIAEGRQSREALSDSDPPRNIEKAQGDFFQNSYPPNTNLHE